MSHHYELSIEGRTATVTFDKYYAFKAIKTLNIEGLRLTVPSVRKLTGIKSDKADLSRKEKEKEEKSQMNVKCAQIVVRWRKNRTWGSTCTAEARVETET